jgi:hypothetical protein
LRRSIGGPSLFACRCMLESSASLIPGFLRPPAIDQNWAKSVSFLCHFRKGVPRFYANRCSHFGRASGRKMNISSTKMPVGGVHFSPAGRSLRGRPFPSGPTPASLSFRHSWLRLCLSAPLRWTLSLRLILRFARRRFCLTLRAPLLVSALGFFGEFQLN